MSYYERKPTINSDGAPGFTTPEDTANENALKARIEKAWDCELHHFGKLCAIDFYALRHNRMVALIEMKSRDYAIDRYPTAMLNVRKWLALTLGQQGLGVPAYFIAGYHDAARWISIGNVDTSDIRMGGTLRLVKSHTDIEPIIYVQLSTMKRLPEEAA
jgi:hypothetical protein